MDKDGRTKKAKYSNGYLINFILENAETKWLFGAGWVSSPMAYEYASTPYRVHINWGVFAFADGGIFSILYSYGLFGVLWVVALWGCILKKAWTLFVKKNNYFYAALAIALIFVPRLRAERTLYAIVSLTIIFSVIGMEWLYKALEQYTYITIRSIVFKFVALVAMFAFVHQKADYVVYGAITLIAASGSSVFNLINAHKFIGMRPVGKYHFKRHFKPIAVFFAMSCATTIYTHLDTVMLGFMKTDADVG